MSTTIDEKVVSMQFDNSNFEKNVQKTLGTVETLQKALEFKNADKSFKGLENAASNLNFDNSILDSNSKITASFDAMSVFAVTALAKIANQAINTGTSLVKSLTVDQLTAGWAKYGQKTESVQTLVNSTGKTVDEIDKYLQRLMWFSDETSYSFTEMTTALGSMTATGGNIDELIPMLMGMANATAYAGKGANEFSRVIYNLNQSYGQGYLSMMDWRSVQNAGVASQALMEQMIEAAKEVGTLDKITSKTAKGNEVSVSNFASTLSDQWATSEVMMKAFGKFSELTMAVEEAVSSGQFDTASEAIQALGGDYDKLAVRAFKSAQEAKSLGEAIDATKDAVSSGFMSTIEMIFGNYEESKTLWTDVANSLWDIFASGAEARNEILGTATDNKWAWEQLIETISGAGVDVDAFQSEMSSALSNAGYDVDDLTARYGSLGNAISHMDIPITLLQKVWKKFSKDTTKYTDDQLKEMGQMRDFFGDTESEVQNLFQTLSTESGRFKIAESITNLLTALQTFANIVSHAISSVFGEIDSDMIYNLLDKVQSFTEWLIISGVETDEVTGEIIGLTGAAKDVADAFSGIFSIIKLVFDIVKSAGQAVGQILGAVFGDEDGNLLTFVGRIGAAVTNVVNFIEESEVISTIFSTIASVISGVVSTIWDFINVFRSSPAVVEFIERLSTNLSTLFTSINEWIQGIKTADNPISYILTGLVSGAGDIIKFGLDLVSSLWDGLQQTIREKAGLAEDESVGGYIITGLINGIRDAIPTLIEVVKDVAKAIIETIKDVLGIHSPSTEAAELGENLITGLWQGIQTGVNTILSEISGFISDVLMGLVNAFNSIDTDKLFAASIALDGLVAVGGTIATIITTITTVFAPLKGVGSLLEGMGSMFEGIGDGISNIGKGVKKYLSGAGFKKVADGIKGIAIGIALILGALFILTFADYNDLQKRVLILGEVMAMLLIVVLVMKFISKDATGLDKVLKAVTSLGVLVLLLAFALKTIGQLGPNQAKQGLIAVLSILGILALILLMIGVMAKKLEPNEMKAVEKTINALGKVVKSLGIAIILMAIAMKIVGSMDTASFVKGIIFMGLFAAFLAVIMIASKKADQKTMKTLSSVLKALSGTLIIMAIVLKIIGSMSWGDLAKGLIGIAALLGFMLLFVWGMKEIDPDGKKFKQISKSLKSFAVVLVILAIVLKLIGSMSWGELARGVIGIAALMGFIMLFVWGMDEIDPDGKKLKQLVKTLKPLSVCLLILGVVLKLIGSMSWGELARGVIGMAALMGFIMLFVWGMDAIDPDGSKLKKIVKSLKPLSIALLLLAVTLKIIGSMSWGELARGIVGMAALMTFILLFVMGMSAIKSDIPAVTGVMIGLSVVLFMMAVVLLIISGLSWEGLAKGLVGVGALVLMLILLVHGLKPVSKDVMPLVVIMGGLILLVMSMAVAILILSKVPFKQALGSVVAMGVLVLTLAAALLILSKTNAVSAKSIIAIVVIIAVAVIFAFLLKLIADIDTISAAANLVLIGAFILVMVVVMAAIGLVAPLAASAMIGLAGLALFVAALTGLLELLGQIADVEAINKAGDALYAIGNAIGRGIGGIIGGIGEGIASSLPAIAESISSFIETINNSTRNTPDIGQLISIIKDVTSLSFGKKTDTKQFSADLIAVAEGICTVAEKFNEKKDLLSDTSTIQNALAISEVLKNITDAIPQEGGLMSKILGSKDMDGFGESIASYATSIGTFATTLSTYKSALSDTSVFEAARDAGLIMNELNEAIPKTGGIVQDILGESDLATFGLKLVAYGTSLGLFGTTLNMYRDVLSDPTLFEFARDVGLMMNEVNEAIPKTGGIVQDILGESDLAEFGLKLVAYGTSLGLFGTTLNMYRDILADQEMFQNAADVGLKMAALQEAIPKSDGWAQKILGKKDMGDFGESMAAFGDALYDFGDSLKDVDLELLNSAMPFVTQIMDAVGKLSANMDKKDAGSVERVIASIGPLGEQLKAFSDNVESVDSISIGSAIYWLGRIADVALTLGDSGKALSNLADGMKALAKSGIDKFVSTIEDAKEVTKIEDTAKEMVKIFSEAASGTESLSAIADATVKLVNKFKTAADACNVTARSAGQNLGQGFINGLASKGEGIYNAGYNAGRKAIIGLNRAIDAHSPSKQAARSGSFFGEGFVKGMDSYADNIYSSASNLGTSAVNSLNNAIAGAKDLIENSVDSQPTIRPVLDLSDVQSGVGRIGSLLNSSPYIFGGSGIAQSISRSFIGQNGRNYDVVSALDRLGSDIVNNTSGNSYVINGVSYEEGSDVAEAIQTLAHAAVINGRR